MQAEGSLTERELLLKSRATGTKTYRGFRGDRNPRKYASKIIYLYTHVKAFHLAITLE